MQSANQSLPVLQTDVARVVPQLRLSLTCSPTSLHARLPAACPPACFPTPQPALTLQAGAMDFYAMDEGRRKTFLDDGLHMTEYGYDQLAGHIANYITPNSHATRKL